MLHRLNAFLIARRTAVTLIAVLLVLMALGYILPQQTVTGPGPNRLGVPGPVLALSAAIGFDRMWSSAVFLGTLGACLISLTAALAHSARLAWRRSTAPIIGAGSLGSQHVSLQSEVVASHLRASGYRPVRPVDGAARFIRHPWGLWGGFVLHLGLVITTAAAIVVLATETWAIVGLAEGEVHTSGSPWSAEEPARFADPIVLSEDLRLDSVTPEYWDNNELRQVTSDITFIAPDGSEVPVTVSVNGSRVFRGVRFFQDQQFGRAFFIEIERDGEVLRERVEMNW
ncbi:MAG: cytochrome c biogenesis protein ResB, partial [Actinomycetota bacterium]|nr:cytochrome c biogenesis protein ResB [Actinomycetota bacterium]